VSAAVDYDRMVWAQRERLVMAARERFSAFAPLVVRDADGNPIRYHPLHYHWIAHTSYAWARRLHAGIFSAFGHGKTSAFAVPLLAWIVGTNPQARIKIVCSGDEMARLRLEAVKNIIESPAYEMIFPGVLRGEKWNNHMAFVERAGHAIDPTIEARGVLTKATGARATHILFDDVVDIENSSNHQKRERLRRTVEKVWLSRLEPGGRVVWIATPWYLEDASQVMQQRQDFVWLTQPVRPDRTGYRQIVHNAGRDYQPEVEAYVAEMMEGA